MALVMGVPVVGSAVAVEGMHLQNKVSVMTATYASEYVTALERLHADPALWLRVREGAFAVSRQYFSRSSARTKLREILAELVIPPPFDLDGKSKVHRCAAVASSSSLTGGWGTLGAALALASTGCAAEGSTIEGEGAGVGSVCWHCERNAAYFRPPLLPMLHNAHFQSDPRKSWRT